MRLIDADELLRWWRKWKDCETASLETKIESMLSQPKPNKLDEMIDYHEGEDMAGNKVSIYPIFREINRQLKLLRGERD